jgi:hypothetical protein
MINEFQFESEASRLAYADALDMCGHIVDEGLEVSAYSVTEGLRIATERHVPVSRVLEFMSHAMPYAVNWQELSN